MNLQPLVQTARINERASFASSVVQQLVSKNSIQSLFLNPTTAYYLESIVLRFLMTNSVLYLISARSPFQKGGIVDFSAFNLSGLLELVPLPIKTRKDHI
jgi:hypothetical protein